MTTTRPRKSIPRTVRAAVLHDGAVCAWCFHPGSTDNILVIDHIIPHSKGGSDDISNLQALCHRCNEGASAKDGAPGGAGVARIPYFATHHFPNGVRA